MDKIGVFFCSGCGIGEAIDLAAAATVAEECGAAFCTTHACLCSEEGVAVLRSTIADGRADSALIAACSSREKSAEFHLDPTKALAERVSFREQVVWSHPAHDEDTQMLAEDLLRMGLARLGKVKPVEPLAEQIDETVLVVGGGLAGLSAVQAARGMGHPVVVIEAAEGLGGHLMDLRGQLPDRPPYDALVANDVSELVRWVTDDPGTRVFCSARTASIRGQPGQFQVEIATSNGGETVTAGSIIQATGARPYDANHLADLGYGRSPDVITAAELDEMLSSSGVRRPSDGRLPRRVVFVQCAGSRRTEHLPYCSSECCATTLRQVALLHQDHPDIETIVVYRDMRTPGQLERFYLAVQEQAHSLFTRGEVQRVEPAEGAVSVHVSESLLGESVALSADLVVLAVGMVPTAADGEAIRALRDARIRSEKGESDTQRKAALKIVEELSRHEGTEILNLDYRQGPDLPTLQYSFPDSHFICFPYESRRTGIYAAGTTRAPMTAAEAREDGRGAAMKAVQCIAALERGETLHPRSGDLSVPDFFLQRCTQCKRCTEECPFGTLNEDKKGTPQVNVLRCRRCGICMGACPERIISFPDYSVSAVSAMVKAMEVPEDYEEKPRIVAFLCENDALPALDAAAAKRRQWSPWVRVIPVRCLGSVNLVWIADALSRGIDGIMLMGCRYGDDYQCHYIRGSELASKRLENIQETLDRLVLEPERVEVVQVAHNDVVRVPDLLDEFAQTIEELGANPFKGF